MIQNDTTAQCQWITVDQLERKLKISRSTVYRWIQNGIIKAYRLHNSRNIYFNNDEIDQFLSMNPIAPSGRLDRTAFIDSQHDSPCSD